MLSINYTTIQKVFSTLRDEVRTLQWRDVEESHILHQIVKTGLKAMELIRNDIENPHRGKWTFNLHLIRRGHIECVLSGGDNKDKRKPGEPKGLKIGLIGYAITRNKLVLNVPDVESPKYKESYDPMNPTTKSELIAPIYSPGRSVIGALNIESSEKSDFDELDESILPLIAQLACVLIDANTTRKMEEYSKSTMKTIINQNMSNVDMLRNGLNSIIESCTAVLDVDAGIIFLEDKNTRQIDVRASVGLKGVPTSVPRDESITDRSYLWEAIETAYPIYMDTGEHNSAYRNSTKSAVAFPFITSHGENGVFALESDFKIQFSVYEKEMERYSDLCKFLFERYQDEKENERTLITAETLYNVAVKSTKLQMSTSNLLDEIAREIRNNYDIDFCFIYLVKEFPKRLEVSGYSGTIPPHFFSNIYYELDSKSDEKSLTRLVFERGIQNVEYVQQHNDFSGKYQRIYDRYDFTKTAFLGAQITSETHRNEPIGVITFGKKKVSTDETSFQNVDVQFITELAKTIGNIMDLKQNNDIIKKQLERYKAIDRRISELESATSEDNLIEIIHRIVREAFRETYCTLYLMNQETKILKMSNVTENYLKQFGVFDSPPEFEIGEGMTGSIAREGTIYQPFVESAKKSKSACADFWNGLTSTNQRYFFGTPVRDIITGEALAVITLNGKREKDFDKYVFEQTTKHPLESLALRMAFQMTKMRAKDSCEKISRQTL